MRFHQVNGCSISEATGKSLYSVFQSTAAAGGSVCGENPFLGKTIQHRWGGRLHWVEDLGNWATND